MRVEGFDVEFFKLVEIVEIELFLTLLAEELGVEDFCYGESCLVG